MSRTTAKLGGAAGVGDAEAAIEAAGMLGPELAVIPLSPTASRAWGEGQAEAIGALYARVWALGRKPHWRPVRAEARPSGMVVVGFARRDDPRGERAPVTRALGAARDRQSGVLRLYRLA